MATVPNGFAMTDDQPPGRATRIAYTATTAANGTGESTARLTW